MLQDLDYKLSDWFFSLGRSLPHEAVVFAAAALIWILAAYLIVLSFFSPRRQRIFLLSRAAAAMALAFVANTALAWLFWRYRPFVTFDFKPLLQPLLFDQSFPSSHAAAAFALAGSIWFHDKKKALLALLLAALISIGRVLAGVHYLSDILAGGFIGLSASWIVAKISFKIPPISREQKQGNYSGQKNINI